MLISKCCHRRYSISSTNPTSLKVSAILLVVSKTVLPILFWDKQIDTFTNTLTICIDIPSNFFYAGPEEKPTAVSNKNGS